jgi:hypothetical protein
MMNPTPHYKIRTVNIENYIALILKNGETNKIFILQEKQEGGFVLHMTNAVRGRILPHLSWSSLKTTLSFFTYHRG